LDDKGYAVQSMRSWSTLQGGETFACIGCHEDKNETAIMPQTTTIALRKAPQKLKHVGQKPHPLMVRLEKESCLDSIENYWGVNVPPLTADPDAHVDGFSYTQEIQPILDRHCVRCHTGDVSNPDKTKASPLSLTGEYKSVEDSGTSSHGKYYKRSFTQSYLTLVNNGKIEGSRYIQWLGVRSRSEMLPPYHTGAFKSPLMKYLEPEHYDVQVADWEKRTIACWIDILIPFCGSLTQANRWTEEERKEYLYYIEKRRFFAEEELRSIKETLK